MHARPAYSILIIISVIVIITIIIIDIFLIILIIFPQRPSLNLCSPRAVRASLLNEVTLGPCYHHNLIINSDVIILHYIVISIIPFIIVVAIFAKNTIDGTREYKND